MRKIVSLASALAGRNDHRGLDGGRICGRRRMLFLLLALFAPFFLIFSVYYVVYNDGSERAFVAFLISW
jgi:hypothetical protein